MQRNKYGFAKRTFLKLSEKAPFLRRIKALSRPFKLSSFEKRLARRQEEVRAAKEQSGRAPLFDLLEIETFNRCNGECAFCPVNKHLDPRPPVRMTDELFISIMDQLRDLEYKGQVSFYSNNEAFLDQRMPGFIKAAREKLPQANLHISTNGLVLTPELYKSVIDNLDELHVNNYSNDFTWRLAILDLMELSCSRPDWWEKTVFFMRYQQETMTSRGGQAPNKQDLKPAATLKVGCMYPSRQMVVRPDGKLSLCCNDALGTLTLGDLSKQTLEEAWYSPAHQAAMEKILVGRDDFPICRQCDTLCD